MITIEKVQKTYDDYAALEEGVRYQLIDGELVMSPSPSRVHQCVVLHFAMALQHYVVEKGLGEVYMASFDVKLSQSEVYQPDILFVAQARLAVLSEQQVEGAPDLVVEVLSPATGYYDLTKKRRVYEAAGVQEYWLVDPIEKTVTVLDNVEGTYHTIAEARDEGQVASQLLEGFAVDLATLFA